MNRIKGYEIIPNLRREEGIKFAAFNISTSCPYKCKYCFVGDIKLKNSLSNKRWKEILDFFLNFSDVETYIFAGTKEPFARKKLLYYLVKKITQANKWAVIYTNLYLIKREELRQLKNMNISLIVKCDSLERDTYEFLVGKKNSFEKFIKNLEYVVELFPENRIGINFQLTKLNLGEMEKVREFFRKRNIEINYRILVKEGYAEKNWDILVGDKYFLLLKYAEKNKIVGRTITSYGKCAFLRVKEYFQRLANF